jgi:hypothetical protein
MGGYLGCSGGYLFYVVCLMEKALFIPLKTEYYNQFASGEKTEELRKYGGRWNEKTCRLGRKVTLSKGYGKHARMEGVIWKFKVQHGSTFGSQYKQAIKDVFGTLDIYIACISVRINNQSKSGKETDFLTKKNLCV